MRSAKSVLTLFAIAAGGFIHAGTASPGPIPAIAPSHASAAADPGLDHRAMQTAAKSALLAEIRHDLKDGQASLRLSELKFDRASGRSMEGHAKGFVLFDAVTAMPIEVTVSYDLAQSRVEYVDYLVTGAALPSARGALGETLRKRIADRIGARLVLEFSQQPVDFSLLDIQQVASSRSRMVVTGTGITRFPGEGAAYTRFVATTDKFSGKVVSVQYELLQEVSDAGSGALASID
jgi:hypothetical protein